VENSLIATHRFSESVFTIMENRIGFDVGQNLNNVAIEVRRYRIQTRLERSDCPVFDRFYFPKKSDFEDLILDL